jgi:hypothetical protein
MIKFAAAVLIILCFCGISYGQGQGQQGTGREIASGTYFSVYSDGPADAYSVLSKIDLNYLVYSQNGSNSGESVSNMLAKTLDGLYQEVSDILDIHIYSFKGTIQVLADQKSLADMFKRTYGLEFNERSIYFFEKNTIYISLADMNVGILGHEISHAIISHYFVVPPPARIQEVLCGYVEYSLRKTRGSLP